ncbi:hypothetical protein WMY93_032340 [Mugilogobius chulae]|uniref:Uncharacterized protein n=1 Tax=Mugilogobius chulae TaxID=88201 RepID=A0AAW0ML55_9GOBI
MPAAHLTPPLAPSRYSPLGTLTEAPAYPTHRPRPPPPLRQPASRDIAHHHDAPHTTPPKHKASFLYLAFCLRTLLILRSLPNHRYSLSSLVSAPLLSLLCVTRLHSFLSPLSGSLSHRCLAPRVTSPLFPPALCTRLSRAHPLSLVSDQRSTLSLISPLMTASFTCFALHTRLSSIRCWLLYSLAPSLLLLSSS